MLSWLATTWEYLRTSFWMVPAIMALAAIGAASMLVAVDNAYPEALSSRINWLSPPKPEASRTLLAALVGAMITVVSVVFSMTIVSLTLAAQQLGPRLLRTFTVDVVNQAVLGTFVATFLYCLLTLWMVGLFDADVVPELSMLGALALAVASVGVLIFFIHHMSQSIQAPAVVFSVGRELLHAINAMYPPFNQSPGDDVKRSDGKERLEPTGGRIHTVCGWRDGYLQYVDLNRMLSIAKEHNLLVQTVKRPGHFVIDCEELAEVRSDQSVSDRVQQELAACFVLGNRRTPTQDVEFAVDQLVEVALRALSPSLNDPFTAMQAIDQLGAALSQLSQRQIPPHEYVDEAGDLRLVVNATDFAGIVDAMFHQIRQSAQGNVAVLIHLMEVLGRVANKAANAAELDAIWKHVDAVFRQAENKVDAALDLEDVRQRYKNIAAMIGRDAEGVLSSR